MMYALDTNILIHYLHKTPAVLHNFDQAIRKGDNLVIPNIVDYELRRGFRIAQAPKKQEAYRILSMPSCCCEVAQTDAYTWRMAEQVYADLHKKRVTIGELDILIAAFCLEKEYTLVTNNTKHFEAVDGLKIVDWTE